SPTCTPLALATVKPVEVPLVGHKVVQKDDRAEHEDEEELRIESSPLEANQSPSVTLGNGANNRAKICLCSITIGRGKSLRISNVILMSVCFLVVEGHLLASTNDLGAASSKPSIVKTRINEPERDQKQTHARKPLKNVRDKQRSNQC